MTYWQRWTRLSLSFRWIVNSKQYYFISLRIRNKSIQSLFRMRQAKKKLEMLKEEKASEDKLEFERKTVAAITIQVSIGSKDTTRWLFSFHHVKQNSIHLVNVSRLSSEEDAGEVEERKSHGGEIREWAKNEGCSYYSGLQFSSLSYNFWRYFSFQLSCPMRQISMFYCKNIPQRWKYILLNFKIVEHKFIPVFHST